VLLVAQREIRTALVAEFLGTLLLVATVVGSGIMAQGLAAGNTAVALLGNTIATAGMLYVLITVFAPVSGAHFNPAVSLVFVLRRELSARHFWQYVPVQILGGICGTFLAHVMFGLPMLQFSTHIRSGFGQYVSEFVATFALVITILGALKTKPEAIPAAVALVITAGYWFTASTSFANPAVTIARALSDSFSGIAPADVPAFIVMQVCGAVAALLVGNVFGWGQVSVLRHHGAGGELFVPVKD
jgi:glycerol uptake facilitator-like aquaporin